MRAIPPDSPDAERETRRRRLASLTSRQREIVMLMGDGARPAEVARELGIARTSVSSHLARIMKKLGLRSKRDLVREAVLLAASAKASESRSSSEPGGGGPE